MSLNKIVYAVNTAKFADNSLPPQGAINSWILQREISTAACSHRLGSHVIGVGIDILPSPLFAPRGVLLRYFAVRNTKICQRKP